MNAAAEIRLEGTAASPGIALARVFRPREAPAAESCAAAGDPAAERASWLAAAAAARTELAALARSTRAELGALKAEIFDSHLAMLDDPELAGMVEQGIAADGLSAAAAVDRAFAFFSGLLAESDDELFRARADDLRDLSRRLRGHIDGSAAGRWAGLDGERVVVAEDLSPSETGQLDRSLVKGFATGAGSRTSHSSILARSLGIPAVVGLGAAGQEIPDGAEAIIDGGEGLVIVNPAPATRSAYLERARRQAARRDQLKAFAARPTRTACGHALEVAANIGGPADLPACLEQGAEGVGLFRTEFMYMDRGSLPTEDEQYRVYAEVLGALAPRPVVIRTLDIGGDKQLPCLPLDAELNPFLGVRALRLCLERRDLFRVQLRALLRASVHGRLRIMFPMVATVDELREAKAEVAAVRAELEAAGVPVAPGIEVGVMIEIPAAALCADALAAEADFFSIGTNDLIQYTMAADRMNPKVAYLYQPLHPAVLGLIGRVAEAARRKGRWTGVCGEMAQDPRAAALLVGLGVDELSVSAAAVPDVRARVAGVSLADARALAARACACGSSAEVEALIPTVPEEES